MNIRRSVIFVAIAAAAIAGLSSCVVKYSLSGASIPPNARTVSIAYFPNNAALVSPILSSTLTEGLQDRFSRQTKLEHVSEGGDLAFEGEIVNYVSTPSSISGDEYAVQNRLTITVKVTFINELDPELSFSNKTFSAFLDYDGTQMLTEVEGQLVPDIVEILVEDIFNAAVANW